METIENTHTNATQITSLSAFDLIGRLVINSHGAEFVVTNLELDARNGIIVIWIDELDPHTGRPMDEPCGLLNLKGWTVANRVPQP